MTAIEGTVSADREPLVSVDIIGLRGDGVSVEAIVDTGFTDYLTLPRAIIRDLQLPYLQTSYGGLADGSTTPLDVHSATVEWGGQRRRVPIYASDGTPLIGMGLLYGHRLTFDAVDGGSVEIQLLS